MKFILHAVRCVWVRFLSLRSSQWTTSNCYHKRKPHLISKSNAKKFDWAPDCIDLFILFWIAILLCLLLLCSFQYEYIRYLTILLIIVYIILDSVIHGNPFSFFHANKKQHWYELFGVYPFLCGCAKKPLCTQNNEYQNSDEFRFVRLVISFAIRIKNTHFRAHVFWFFFFFFSFLNLSKREQLRYYHFAD